MKTNVSIELTDEERDAIATVLDGKMTKRLATRGDIVELVTKFIGGFTADASYKAGKEVPETARFNADPTITRGPITKLRDLYRIRDGEAAMLKGKSDSYIRGWNSARTDGR
jgi:hypothetical protein